MKRDETHVLFDLLDEQKKGIRLSDYRKILHLLGQIGLSEQ